MLESIVKKILVTHEEIETIVSRLAEEINRDYADKKLVIVCVLKGSILFTADLVKKINLVNEMEFMRVSTYGNSTESSGEMKMLLDFDREDFTECDFLIVEDIVDSGNTLSKLVKNNTGKTFKDLLQEKRMSEAEKLISNTKIPITEIIFSVGYENTNFFYKMFTEKFGCTPKEYRKNMLAREKKIWL